MQEDIKQLRDLYAEADKLAREVSNLRAEVVIPAHNELRYAGYHLLQSLDPTGKVVDEEQLGRAKRHCERAKYDAAEAGILHAIDTIRHFLREYRDLVIVQVVSNVAEIRALVKSAEALIADGRSETSFDATECMKKFRELSGALDHLEHHRDDLNAKVNEKRKSTRMFIAGLVWAGAVALASFILRFLLLPTQ